ncbi:GNAT family N-acetyltransferase [Thalassotalea sediminis]|uniref:GNAT family N-acetyltransferase n=1 Tax=Thalassotalea sediminis TaxID=1759089 RepID=UPI002573DFAB|nr:GNAT family N-acetyltransferase [Thalassotalea sediminis]
MITKLTMSNELVARQVYRVFQRSYKIEATLIGVDKFPPLFRPLADFVDSQTEFYGVIDGDALTAVIEVSADGEYLMIDSLVVDPDYFKQGLAGKLLQFVMEYTSFNKLIVETATLNKPAIRLYQKYGFCINRYYTPAHGIEKVVMTLK